MKRKILVMIALMLVVVLSLSSCGALNWFKNLFAKEIELTDAPLNAETLIDFANGANPDVLFESDGWSNGDVFNVVWKSHNVHYEDGIMRLGITEEKATAWVNDAEVEYKYTAGEARTQNYYHYGDYEVSMKPSANGGTASTFFVCTGPYDLKDGVPNAHDEIDIEFLGKDTTHVQFNFFVDGVGGNEFMYDLGFDASKEFHTYGFRWEENAITWFVDGEPVYKVTTDDVEEGKNLKHVDKLPSTAGRILTNYWCGNERAYGWMGEYKGETADNGTTYQWIKTSAKGAPLNPPVVTPPVEGGDDEEINWADIAPIAPTFATTPEYTVVIDGNKANVTYTDISSTYKNIEMDVTEAVAGKNYLYLKVTNNGTEMVQVRVNMFDPTLEGKNNNTSTNISATMNGQPVFTDTAWGGSFFEIPAGESAELVLNFGVGGVKLQLMIDSSRNDSTLRSGDVTVEDIKFAAVGDVEAPHKCADADEDGKCDECGKDMPTTPPVVDHPVSGNLSTTIGGTTVKLSGNTADGYGVNVDENNNIIVEYTNIIGNSYKNIWADLSAIAGTKTTFTMKVTNNGEEAVKVRIDIESKTQTSAYTTCCNVSATMNGEPASTDKEYGGSMFVIEAGATATLEVVYDASKLPTNIKIMIDSCQWDDETSHAGSIVISDLGFSGEYVPEAGGDDPVDPKPEPDTGLQFEFWTSSDDYTANGHNIKYNGAGNSYSCAGTDIAALAAGKTTFTVTITNNGTATSRVRVDIQGTTKVGEHTVLNTSATGGDVWTDAEYGGSTVTVEPGQSVTLVIEYDVNTERGAPTNLVLFVDASRGDGETYSSDITLSGMAFSGEAPAPEEPKMEYTDLYVEFKTEDAYVITTTDTYVNSAKITYADMLQNSWKNINIWVEDKSADCSIFSMKLTNHGEATVSVWVQMKDAAGAELINQNVDIEAGAEEVFTFEYTGVGKTIYFFVDSTHEADAELNTGEITISELKLGKVAAEEPGEEPGENEEALKLTFNTGAYTIDPNNVATDVLNVSYANLTGGTYANVCANVADIANDYNAFTITIKNNGEAKVRVRIDIKATNTAGNTNVCNQSSQGGGSWTDLEWGGSFVDVEAGAEVTVTVYYDANEYFGPATELLVYFDTSTYGDTNTYSGNLTISGFEFFTAE